MRLRNLDSGLEVEELAAQAYFLGVCHKDRAEFKAQV